MAMFADRSDTNRGGEPQAGPGPNDGNAVLVVAGGVAANQAIRIALGEEGGQHGFRLIAPPMRLCSDNGVMIAWAGAERLALGLADRLDAPARARWPLTDLSVGEAAAVQKRVRYTP